MKASAQRVQAALHSAGLNVAITEFAESTRTAEQAAAAVGANVGQIVKSLVFVAGDRPILALVSGPNRADTDALARLAGGAIARATPDQVRAATGYSIGGVPPLGHATALPIYIDRALLAYETVWAAAGTPNAVFPIAPADLVRVTGGQVADFAG